MGDYTERNPWTGQMEGRNMTPQELINYADRLKGELIDLEGQFREWWDEHYPDLLLSQAIEVYMKAYPGRIAPLLLELLKR